MQRSRLMRSPGPADTRRAESHRHYPRPLGMQPIQKILLAEDGTVDALLLRNILTRAGYHVVTVPNGARALEVLESDPDIDMVVTDVVMPEMDGAELLRTIRSRKNLARLPVVFVTATSDSTLVREALGLGLGGYILKPLTQPSRVLDTVRRAAAAHPQG